MHIFCFDSVVFVLFLLLCGCFVFSRKLIKEIKN